MAIKETDCVKTKVGDGQVSRVDKSTYSIPLFIVKLTKGRHKGEEVALVESQLIRRKCRLNKSRSEWV